MSRYPPIRQITHGPKFHWFGYYDKLQVDPTNRFALGMEVDFEHRSPTAKDTISLGIIDLKNNNDWTEISSTKSWCWQQGCMLQWIPNSEIEVIWNTREDDSFVSNIYNLETRETRNLSQAIYALSPNGQTAIGTDFRRINHMRPGYGYAGIPDPNYDKLAPNDTGIYSVNLSSSYSKLIVTIAEVSAIPFSSADISKARHYFNHLLFNTNGSRFIFLHRWRFGKTHFKTRMMTANTDGSNLHVVDDSGEMSHFIWRDPYTILGWSYHPSYKNKFYLFKDLSDEAPKVLGAKTMTVNGHCSYLPGNKWILNDTYPSKNDRSQIPYLFNIETDQRIDLGIFPSPKSYTGEWRCDLHPRFSPDGKFVIIDSAHKGQGRQMYQIEIENLV